MHVIVIGGGIVGASTAYHLVRAGASCTLVEAARPGAATAAGAGLIFPWPMPGQPQPDRDFALDAAAHYPRLMAELADDGHDPGYRRVGGLSISDDPRTLDTEHRALTDLAGQPGYETMGEVHRLAPGEPARRFPVLSDHHSGLTVAGAGRLDGARARTALLDAAEERGLRRTTGQAHLALHGRRATGIDIAGDHLAADAVVLAAGAWSAELLRPHGIDLDIFPVRGQIAHLTLPDHTTAAHWPTLRVAGGTDYLAAFGPNRVVLSATREPHAGFDPRITAHGLGSVLTRAVQIAPGLADATVAETRVGLRPATPDGRQLLGPLTSIDGLIVATGLGAVGLTYGPWQGALAARLATGEADPAATAAFAPQRTTTT